MSENDHPSNHSNKSNNKKKNLIDSLVNPKSKGSDKTPDNANKPATEENTKGPKWLRIVRGVYDRIPIIHALTFCTLIAYIIVNMGQYSQTRKALNRSDTANFYTKQSLDFSREIAKKELRAYVSINSYSQNKFNSGILGVVIEIINTGKTPTFNISFKTIFELAVDSMNPNLVKKAAISKHENIDLVGAGQKHIIVTAINLNYYKSIYSQIISGEKPIFLLVHIRYYDIFNELHITQSCVSYTFTDNAFIINDKYNYAD